MTHTLITTQPTELSVIIIIIIIAIITDYTDAADRTWALYKGTNVPSELLSVIVKYERSTTTNAFNRTG